MKESVYLEGQNHLVEKIKLIPVFQQFDDNKIKDLLRVSKIRTYEPDEVIIREGDREKCMYFIFSGCVQILKGEKPIAKLSQTGDIFGEMGLVDGEPRSATVIALTETACLVVDATHLESLQDEGHDSFHAAIYRMFAHILTQRLRVTTENYLKVKKELDQSTRRG